MTKENEWLRPQMVKAVIAQHAGEPVTVEHLAQYLPEDFDLGADDLAPYQDVEFEPAPPITGTMPPPITGDKQPITPRVPDKRVIDPATVAAMTPKQAARTAEAIDAAVSRRIKADQDLANRRVELLTAQSAERDARTKLALHVQAFQNGLAPITPQELRNQYVREQSEIRAAMKDGRLARHNNPGIGKSVVDRMAHYGRGGNPARGDYRRGAYPSQAFGAPNRDPARGPVFKPPEVL